MSTVQAIKAFNDNYIWSIVNDKNDCALVDPGDGNACIKYMEANGLKLSAILITHHHHDHTGGISTLIEYAQRQGSNVTVYGPKNEETGTAHIKLEDGQTITLENLDLKFNVLDVPGHTAGHIAYVNQQWLFCGDTLFSGGCGRLFEGTAKQMLNSLTKLANLPDTTQVYCAHEYTSANLTFALAVEPDNQELIDYQQHVAKLRAQDNATIPTTIGQEKKVNPFLRSHVASVKASADHYAQQSHSSNVEVFAAIRRWKDEF